MGTTGETGPIRFSRAGIIDYIVDLLTGHVYLHNHSLKAEVNYRRECCQHSSSLILFSERIVLQYNNVNLENEAKNTL